MHHDWNDFPYAEVRDNAAMLQAFAANAERIGRPMADPAVGHRVVGSTDMGNVSYLTPSIHPMIQVAPARRVDPQPGVHRATPAARRATGPSSTGPRPWP